MFLFYAAAVAANPVADHMMGHFAEATDAAWFVAQGDLARAREHARTLNHDLPEGVPDGFTPLADSMRAAAHDVAAAASLADAALGVAVLATTCADCHGASGLGPRLGPDEEIRPGPSDEPTLRHGWAMYWMWTGLLAPEPASWAAGAQLAVLPEWGYRRAGVTKVERRYERTARKAIKAETTADRVMAFGELLQTCIACHEPLGVSSDL